MVSIFFEFFLPDEIIVPPRGKRLSALVRRRLMRLTAWRRPWLFGSFKSESLVMNGRRASFIDSLDSFTCK